MEKDKWIVHIYGKGMNVTIEIKEIKDLKIVKLLIKRVKKYMEK